MANEFAPFKTRARMVAAMACGFAVGAASGGLLQAEMVPYFGCREFSSSRNHTARSGSGAGVVLARIRALSRNDGGKGDEIARTLAKIDKRLSFPPDTEFVLPAEPKKNGFRPSSCFAHGRAATTILLWFTFLVTLTRSTR